MRVLCSGMVNEPLAHETPTVKMTQGYARLLSDEDAQLSMVTRLIAIEADAEQTSDYLAQIDGAMGQSDTTKKEQKELFDERQGSATSHQVALQDAEAARAHLTSGPVVLRSLSGPGAVEQCAPTPPPRCASRRGQKHSRTLDHVIPMF